MPDITPTTRSCFACGGGAAIFIDKIGYALYDDSPLCREYRLVSCSMCGAVFYDFPTPPALYRTYYEKNDWYNSTETIGAGRLSEHERSRFEHVGNLLREYFSRQDVVIADIGCAQGGGLTILRELGWRNLIGLDPLSSNVKALQTSGFTAVVGTVEDIPLSEKSCSCLILSHILEHVVDMRQALSEVHRVLADDGILYVEVPDGDKYSAYPEAPLFDFIHEHINHFDMYSLINAMYTSGFSLVKRGTKKIKYMCLQDDCIYGIFKKNSREKIILPSHMLHEKCKKLFQQQKQKKYFLSSIIDKGSDIYVWGLSSYMMQILFEIIYKVKEKERIILLDSDLYKQSKTIDFIPIIPPPNHTKEMGPDSVMLLPIGPYYTQMIKHLQKIGYEGTVFVV